MSCRSPNRRQPFVDEWIVGYRRQFGGQVSLDASFIQRRYRHRPALVEVNGIYDGGVFRGYRNEAFNNIFLVTSNQWNWPVYSGFELTASKQTRWMQLLAGYTRAFQHLAGTWQPNDPASFIEPDKFDNNGGLGSISRANETNSLSGNADIRNQMWLKHIGRLGRCVHGPMGSRLREHAQRAVRAPFRTGSHEDSHGRSPLRTAHGSVVKRTRGVEPIGHDDSIRQQQSRRRADSRAGDCIVECSRRS